jgi:hypothetical protein
MQRWLEARLIGHSRRLPGFMGTTLPRWTSHLRRMPGPEGIVGARESSSLERLWVSTPGKSRPARNELVTAGTPAAPRRGVSGACNPVFAYGGRIQTDHRPAKIWERKGRMFGYPVVSQAPSTKRFDPEMYEASSLARKSAAAAMSSGVPARRSGMRSK